MGPESRNHREALKFWLHSYINQVGYLIFLLMVVDILKVAVSAFLGSIICVLAAQSCSALCNSMDCRPPGFSVHGILQARILEWAAIPFFRASSWSRDWTQVFCIAGGFFTIWATREALTSCITGKFSSFLCLSFLICKIGIVIGLLWASVYVKHPEQHLTYSYNSYSSSVRCMYYLSY